MCILMRHVVLQAQTIWKKMETNMHNHRMAERVPKLSRKWAEEKKQIIYALFMFLFPSFYKMAWLQLRYTQKEAHRAISTKWNPTDSTALLLFQSSLQKVVLFSALFFLLAVSSCHFLFSSSPLHVSSELLISSCLAWIFFLRSFACSSRSSSKGEHSLEVNHAPQTQAPDHIMTVQKDIFSFSHFRSRCSLRISVWTHFQSSYISKKDTTGGLFAET